ncbi:PAS domain-containing protein [bacterium]|nr:PAS domain-containing protein [bacterium]
MPAPAGDAPASETSLFSALLGQLPGVVWAADRTLRCRYASPAARRALGLTVGADLAATLAPLGETGGALVEGHRAALEDAAAEVMAVVEGHRVRCRLEPLRDGGGAIVGVLGSAESTPDISVETQRAVFASALEDAPGAIAICDTAGRFIYLNAAAKRFADRDATGSRIADDAAFWGQWHHERGPLQVEQWPLRRALRGEVVAPIELRKDLADGTQQHMYLGAAPLRDPGGTIIGAVATAVDITPRKRAEEQVRRLNAELERRVQERTTELEQAIHGREREALERLRALEEVGRGERLLSAVINHSTAVIYLKDLEGRYLLVNQHFERLFGVRGAEFVGRGTDYDVFPHAAAEAVRANDRLVLESGGPLHIEELVPIRGRERAYISVKFPLRDAEGNVYGICGMSTDITERQQMEAALRRSEATLASIIESSIDPICALSRDWQLVALNTAASRLIPELIGSLPPVHASLGQIPEDFAAQWRGLLERGMAGERFTVERTLPIGGGRQFLVAFNPTVQDGAVTGVAVFGREITELRRAEEDARQHQAELAHVLRLHTMGEMAASLAHEVNQPLGAIANYAQGCRNHLVAGRVDQAELLHTVEAIAREALRAGEITRRVRELLRKEEAPRAWADAAEIIRAALEIVAATARRHDVALTVGSDMPALPVFVDRIQIEQVVVNLMLNAVDATRSAPEPRLVEVRATIADDVVEVAVGDNGSGIDPAVADRIFDPFLTTKPGGLGMGLAISRSIVIAHGGTLWHTPNPGGGTTFHFTLPPDDRA